jgi:general secretion pathway protein F/type IV pilus assembly protein PilC
MAHFWFKAVEVGGKSRSGVIEAASEKDARESIRAQGLQLVNMRMKASSSKATPLRGEELVQFTHQLARLIEAGIPLYESLVALEEHTRGEKWHGIVLRLRDHVKEGLALSQALAFFPKSFDRLYLSMIKAGEATGTLGVVCERLSSLLDRQHKLKRQLWTALLYPMLLGGFAFVVVCLLLLFVVPSIEALFEGRPISGLTGVVLLSSRFFTRFWPLCFLAIGACIGWGYWYLSHPPRRLKGQKLLMRLPLIKTVLTQAATARFSRTMFTLLKGGVNLIDSLASSRQVMRNPLLENVVEHAAARVIEGERLSTELKKSSLIPQMVPRMLAIGEEGGDVTVMFQKIAEVYEAELEKSLSRLTALAQPVILIVMGGVVGIVMLAVLLPLTDASAFIGG